MESNTFLLFLLKGVSSVGMVRVLSIGTAERTLLKGFTGGVADLGFAHLNSNQLACVDEAGNLFVWQLNDENGKIQYPFDLSFLKNIIDVITCKVLYLQGIPT